MTAKEVTPTKPSAVRVQVNGEVKPLLDLMLSKANLTLTDLNDSFIRLWISENTDLLTKDEREKYKHLFLHR